LIDKLGKIHNGRFKPENNEVCKPDRYAAHTGGGNTSSIGVAMCGMAGFKSRIIVGNYPICKKQFESCMEFCAELCHKYKIPVTPQTVLTHYEYGLNHPKTSSAGKIDIIYLPPYSWVSKEEIGSFIRTKVKWYLK
jgi:N-acetyl-anhydromuramyl-L-alanine amidase AmpD